jgi:hypothetical protein
MNEKENLLDRMIRIYGFEHPITIAFAKLIENPDFPTQYLELIVRSHEEDPQYCED